MEFPFVFCESAPKPRSDTIDTGRLTLLFIAGPCRLIVCVNNSVCHVYSCLSSVSATIQSHGKGLDGSRVIFLCSSQCFPYGVASHHRQSKSFPLPLKQVSQRIGLKLFLRSTTVCMFQIDALFNRSTPTYVHALDRCHHPLSQCF